MQFKPAPRIVVLIFAIFIPAISSAIEDDFDKSIGSYLSKHCVSCHGPKKQESEFRIDTLSKNVGSSDTAQWAEIRERISAGEMPPEELKDPPSADEGAAIVQWLSDRIKEGEAARLAKRDRVNFYRLSREEYVHSIYDLFGVHFDATAPGGLSEDPDWHGFERIGSILTLSPAHIEKYFHAAETILAEAYPDAPPKMVKVYKPAKPLNSISEPYRTRLEEKGLLDKVRFDLWPQDKHRYSKPDRLTAPGVYEARFKLSGLKPANGRAPRLMVYHQKLDRVLFERDIVAPEDQPVTVSFQTHLPEGSQSIVVINDVPGPSNLPRSGRHGRKPFVSIKDGRIPWQLKLTDESGAALYPFLILDGVEWEGPIITDREQNLRDAYMPTEEGNMDEVRKRLTTLARRAFRRPLKDGEIEKYVGAVNGELKAGADFRSAVKTGMLAILCSKSFLFLVEGAEDEERHQLNDWELASRLSYFLWNTMPDQKLFELAAKGTLHERPILEQQIERMLADPKADRFATSFPWQWLRLKKVGMFPPDAKLYPQYDKHLENSMIAETTEFFREVLQSNLNLREFIDSKWTMINPRLALHYEIQGIQLDEFQRVALAEEDNRGGILTHASVLSLTSDGTRHRPVHRGVWLSETILGKTPPPPPANVDAIEPTPADQPKATLRMKLDAHKSNANCASCHRKIDPLGFAFDNYDAIGSWRTEEIVQNGTGKNPPVDASGELPDGRKFSDAAQFKKLLLDDIDTFNATFVKKLATYGLRRAMTFEDKEELDAISAQSRASDYRVRDIVKVFILSDLFRKR